VYLRQSSERQVQHHTESQRLQYDLVLRFINDVQVMPPHPDT
jgi:hypothetical protein